MGLDVNGDGWDAGLKLKNSVHSMNHLLTHVNTYMCNKKQKCHIPTVNYVRTLSLCSIKLIVLIILYKKNVIFIINKEVEWRYF